MKCQICEKIEHQHKHRIISGCYGGKYKKDNVAYLCASCHYDVHTTKKVVIEGIFLTTLGYKLIWHNTGEESLTNKEQLDKVYFRTS